MKLSPTEIYQDRRIFLIGSTGFLGKVTLSMLLHRFPNVGKIYLTVRARSQEESETRFWNNIVTAPPFDPLRERYGSALDGFIKDKVIIRGGDIADTNFGYSEEEAQAIADDIDIIINSAGNVTFNPTLESGLRTNVVGTQNVIAFAKRMKRPALVHVSTCFVAGNRSGAIWESDDVLGYFPRRKEMPGVEFSVDQEIADCAKLADRVRDEARDAMMAAKFRELARRRLNEEGRDVDDPDALGLAVARERKVWTRTRLTDLGVERAAYWGWPNIYTYTKSLGEQLVAAETSVVRSIVRPGLPLVGQVAAGQPVLAEENIEDYVATPTFAGGDDGGYLLRVRGESMKDVGILDGDLVVVRPQDTAQDSDIVVALVGEEATVKRFFQEADHVRLQPENEAMEPIRSRDVRVLGKVVGLMRSMR